MAARVFSKQIQHGCGKTGFHLRKHFRRVSKISRIQIRVTSNYLPSGAPCADECTTSAGPVSRKPRKPHLYLKNGEVYASQTSCMRRSSIHTKKMWIKQPEGPRLRKRAAGGSTAGSPKGTCVTKLTSDDISRKQAFSCVCVNVSSCRFGFSLAGCRIVENLEVFREK